MSHFLFILIGPHHTFFSINTNTLPFSLLKNTNSPFTTLRNRAMTKINITTILTFLTLLLTSTEAKIPGIYTGGAWQTAHATFYGGSDASGTMGKY
jgi:hypothetical protein